VKFFQTVREYFVLNIFCEIADSSCSTQQNSFPNSQAHYTNKPVKSYSVFL